MCTEAELLAAVLVTVFMGLVVGITLICVISYWEHQQHDRR